MFHIRQQLCAPAGHSHIRKCRVSHLVKVSGVALNEVSGVGYTSKDFPIVEVAHILVLSPHER